MPAGEWGRGVSGKIPFSSLDSMGRHPFIGGEWVPRPQRKELLAGLGTWTSSLALWASPASVFLPLTHMTPVDQEGNLF